MFKTPPAVAILLALTLVQVARAAPPLDVPVNGNTDIGVGFGHLSNGPHNLEVILNAGSDDISRSTAYDKSGTALWEPSENDTVAATHVYNAYGVTPNDGHAVRFYGVLLIDGGAGKRGGQAPDFLVAVADIDIDVDSDGPPGSITEDENETGFTGAGMEMPTTESGSLLELYPSSDTNWFPLRVVLRNKVPGTLSISAGGQGVGVYRDLGGASSRVSSSINVAGDGLEESFHIRTDSTFTSAVDITATFTPSEGFGSPQDVVTVYPTSTLGSVNITMDANRDDVLDGTDDALESEGIVLFSTSTNPASLHAYGTDLVGFTVELNSVAATFTPNGSGSTPADSDYVEWLLGSGDANTHIEASVDVFEEFSGATEGSIEIRLLDPIGMVVDSELLVLLAPTLVKFSKATPMEFVLGGGTANSNAGVPAGGTAPDSNAKPYAGQLVQFQAMINDVDQWQKKPPGMPWGNPETVPEDFYAGLYRFDVTVVNATIDGQASKVYPSATKVVSNIPVKVDSGWTGATPVEVVVEASDFQVVHKPRLKELGYELAPGVNIGDVGGDPKITKTINWAKATVFPKVATAKKQEPRPKPQVVLDDSPFKAHVGHTVVIWYKYGPDLNGAATAANYAGVMVEEHFSPFNSSIGDLGLFTADTRMNHPDPTNSVEMLAELFVEHTRSATFTISGTDETSDNYTFFPARTLYLDHLDKNKVKNTPVIYVILEQEYKTFDPTATPPGLRTISDQTITSKYYPQTEKHIIQVTD